MIANLETCLGAGKKSALESSPKDFPQRSEAGSAAEAELVEEHLPLVKKVVNRLGISLSPYIDGDDLYSSGLVGLLNAARKFDPAAGSTFEAYARVRIRGAAIDELRRLDWVPRSVHAKSKQVDAVQQKLEQTHGETPTNDEMARALKLSTKDYEALLEEIRPKAVISFDGSPIAEDDDEQSQYEQIADDSCEDPGEAAERREMAQIVMARIEELPQAQREVLNMYYFEDMRLAEIAEVFGVTKSRISQIHSQALRALRTSLKDLQQTVF